MESKPHYLGITVILLIAYSLCHVSYKVGYAKGSNHMYESSNKLIEAQRENLEVSDSLIDEQRKLIKLQDSIIFNP